MEAEWNASQSNAAACYLHYVPSNNTIQLSNDAGTGWIGPASVGSAGTLQNSQCTLDAGSSSVSTSGNNLTLNVALTFLPAFGGAKNVYMQYNMTRRAISLTPWQARGTWSASATAPANVSVSPSNGGSGDSIKPLLSFTAIRMAQPISVGCRCTFRHSSSRKARAICSTRGRRTRSSW